MKFDIGRSCLDLYVVMVDYFCSLLKQNFALQKFNLQQRKVHKDKDH